MLQGTCINNDILPAGEAFYLFPANDDYVYVSRFPRKSAHSDCFEKKYFQIKEEIKPISWPPEPPEPPKRAVEMGLNEVYAAKLIWCWEASKDRMDKEYYVIVRGSGIHVDYYPNPELEELLGSLPVHCFEKFRRNEAVTFMASEESVSEQAPEAVKFDEESSQFIEQLSLF
ncbi:hypothetical protein AWH48_15740 [Domibacillus aminovorans]|uniref:Uncharacterized protein n=1 Tax=Domibacillus aminovorans TaxID=29332 RepID=A0A177L1J4_9BACI|nr:hypothetical protein [Domibacillus aminovorans]OAH59197.1 hypothetical protein AWH48_15740 [Domibacillus aminovorans]